MNSGSSRIEILRLGADAPPSYVADLARLHESEIHGGFLASLGRGVLHTLYRELARSPHAVVLGAVEDGRVIGMICGATDTKGVYRRFLLRSAWRLAPRMAFWMLSPSRLFRLAETLLYPMKKTSVDLPEEEVLNFCVDRACQGKGVGQRLFERLVKEFAQRGVRRIRIVTGASQKSAQRFYDAAGAIKACDASVHRGTQSYIYVYEIRPQSVDSPVRKAA